MGSRLHDFTVQFWTIAAASSIDFLIFGVVYSWLIRKLHLENKHGRRWVLLQCAIICYSAVVLELATLVVGLKLPFLQTTMLGVSKTSNIRSRIH